MNEKDEHELFSQRTARKLKKKGSTRRLSSPAALPSQTLNSYLGKHAEVEHAKWWVIQVITLRSLLMTHDDDTKWSSHFSENTGAPRFCVLWYKATFIRFPWLRYVLWLLCSLWKYSSTLTEKGLQMSRTVAGKRGKKDSRLQKDFD